VNISNNTPDTSKSYTAYTADMEKQWLIQVLQSCNYNISEAAKRIGVCRATIYNKIKKYRILTKKHVL